MLPPEPGDRQLGLLWGGVALGLILLSPFALYLERAAGRCPFKAVTNVPCPTCGTTRSALALARLEPLEALVHYPLPTVVWVLFLAGGLVAGAMTLRRQPLPSLPRRMPVGWRVAVVAVVLLNWAYSIATGV